MAIRNKSLVKLNKILSQLKIHVQFLHGEDVEYVPQKLHKKRIVDEHARYAIINISLSYFTFLNFSKKEIESFLIKTIAHELGHFLVVSPKRRRQKDFGIPTIPSKTAIKTGKYDYEEAKAQAVETEILEKIGFDHGKLFDYRENVSIKQWWQSQGKPLVDNLFYILGV